jgi:hypothetical protein
MLASLTTPALIGLYLAAAILAALTDWRLNLAALAGLFACAAILLANIALWQVVAVRLLVGLLVVSILTLTGRAARFNLPASPADSQDRANVQRFTTPTSFPFRFMALTLVSLAAWYTASQPALALPGLPPALNLASYLLMGLGLLNLGLSEEPFNAGLGLFMLLGGFQLFYFAIEPSLAIVGLLAAVELGVALAVSYLSVLGYAPAEESA